MALSVRQGARSAVMVGNPPFRGAIVGRTELAVLSVSNGPSGRSPRNRIGGNSPWRDAMRALA